MTGPYRVDRPNHPPEWFSTEDAALAAEARMRRDGARDVVVWRDDAVYEAYVAPRAHVTAPRKPAGVIQRVLGHRGDDERRSA